MKNLPTLSFIVALLVFSLNVRAQKMQQYNSLIEKAFSSKVSELYTKYKTDGFITYKGGNINMEKNTEFPIFVELKEGRWYQFVVVGDPEARKLEMKLSKEGVGDIVTDKFKTEDTNEYWTTFSFICPHSGKYLLTFFQRGPKKDLLGHVAILQRPQKSEEGIYTFKH